MIFLDSVRMIYSAKQLKNNVFTIQCKMTLTRKKARNIPCLFQIYSVFTCKMCVFRKKFHKKSQYAQNCQFLVIFHFFVMIEYL